MMLLTDELRTLYDNGNIKALRDVRDYLSIAANLIRANRKGWEDSAAHHREALEHGDGVIDDTLADYEGLAAKVRALAYDTATDDARILTHHNTVAHCLSVAAEIEQDGGSQKARKQRLDRAERYIQKLEGGDE